MTAAKLRVHVLTAILIISPLTLGATPAHAFCGFYVAGGESSLFNDATQVVLMRWGQRTVLSMQNNYQGPPENFAMVVPVPVVLQQENVKTLSPEIFAKVDNLSAPRLVEYWEHDPCITDYYDGSLDMATSTAPDSAAEDGGGGVVVDGIVDVGTVSDLFFYDLEVAVQRRAEQLEG